MYNNIGGAMPRLGDGSPSIDLTARPPTGLRKADEEEELASLAHEGWIQRSTGLTAMEHSLAATPFEV